MSNFWLVQHKQKWSAQCKELALNEGAWLALFLPPSYFLEYRHNDELKQPFWTKNENKPLKRAEWKIRKKVKSLSRFRLFATPWTVAYQSPPPWDFPGKSTRVGCHFLLWGSSQPRNWTRVSAVQTDALPSEPPGNFKRGVVRIKWGDTCKDL